MVVGGCRRRSCAGGRAVVVGRTCGGRQHRWRAFRKCKGGGSDFLYPSYPRFFFFFFFFFCHRRWLQSGSDCSPGEWMSLKPNPNPRLLVNNNKMMMREEAGLSFFKQHKNMIYMPPYCWGGDYVGRCSPVTLSSTPSEQKQAHTPFIFKLFFICINAQFAANNNLAMIISECQTHICCLSPASGTVGTLILKASSWSTVTWTAKTRFMNSCFPISWTGLPLMIIFCWVFLINQSCLVYKMS